MRVALHFAENIRKVTKQQAAVKRLSFKLKLFSCFRIVSAKCLSVKKKGNRTAEREEESKRESGKGSLQKDNNHI